MYGPTDLKKNTLITLDGQPYKVVEYSQKVMGRGGSIVNVKVKNLITGALLPKTFKGQEKIEPAEVTNKTVQYLYNDGELYYFMDTETYEQIPLDASKLGDNFKFVKENDVVKLMSYKGNVFSVEPPMFVVLEVVETEPGVRGDTATNVTKPATLETGAVIKVPIFINEGEILKIDTRTGDYVERVN